MTDVITTQDQLDAALAAIPSPPEGYVRVYRGQNEDYGIMVPTLLRGDGDPRDFLWLTFASLMARDVALQAQAADDHVGDDVGLMIFWVRAIKQHYGPGTEFLDVTHSPGVAVWFALHEALSLEMQAEYGSPGPFDPDRDVVATHEFFKYRRYEAEPAYLYAFDVPAPGPGLPGFHHGSLVDLADAPPAFASGPRIAAQRACLLRAGEEEGGDLSEFYAPETPLRVAWPMEGTPEAGWTTNEIFPTTAEDDWYARFVALPLVPDLSSRAGDAVRYRHPVRVSLHMPDAGIGDIDMAGLDDLTGRIVCVPPPLVFPEVLRWVRADGTEPEWAPLAEATAILMDGPAFYAMPPIDSINQGLLATGWTDTAPTRRSGDDSWSGEARLDNVFLELSMLEEAGWERTEQPGGGFSCDRAVWVRRLGDEFELTTFQQQIPRPGVTPVGPWRVVYDDETRKLAVMRADGARAPLDAVPELARPFLKAMSIVRDLAPAYKIATFPTLVTGFGDTKRTMVAVQWAIAELVGLDGYPTPLNRYHVVRLLGTDEPFLGGASTDSPALSGTLQFERGPDFPFVERGGLLAAAGDGLAAPPPDVWRARFPN